MPAEDLRLSDIRVFLDSGKSLEVSREVLPDDAMYAYSADLYFKAGPVALRCIYMALLAARRTDVRNILDFASGGGRIMRYLRAAFPDADITACDLYTAGINFCAKEFGAKAIQGFIDIDKIPFEGPYDLIWVGSLFTHLGEVDWDKMLTRFQDLLSPDGVLVFTVYGRTIAHLVRSGQITLDLKKEHVDQFVRDYDERGFAFFGDLVPDVGHGDAMAKRSWTAAKLDEYPQLRLLWYMENAWLNQDVVACAKTSVHTTGGGAPPATEAEQPAIVCASAR